MGARLPVMHRRFCEGQTMSEPKKAPVPWAAFLIIGVYAAFWTMVWGGAAVIVVHFLIKWW